jgi:hypothetical protein
MKVTKLDDGRWTVEDRIWAVFADEGTAREYRDILTRKLIEAHTTFGASFVGDEEPAP